MVGQAVKEEAKPWEVAGAWSPPTRRLPTPLRQSPQGLAGKPVRLWAGAAPAPFREKV